MDLLRVIEDFPNQIREGLGLAKEVKVEKDCDAIVVTGMGGSGIPGDVLKTVLRESKIPIVVNKDYNLPGFVSSKTLVFVISYSGDTEETLACYKEALQKRARIVAITSGGKLRELARKEKHPLIIVPSGLPPRFAIAYQFFPMLAIIHNNGIAKIAKAEIVQTIQTLRDNFYSYKEKAQELAERLVDKIPLVYCSAALEAVALRWKQALNENSKIHAFANVFSEMNHNELMAFEKPKGYFHVILLRDERDHPQIRKRMDLTKELVSNAGLPLTEIMLKGTSRMVKIFTAIVLGDLVSFHLAQKLGVDPVETSYIEEFKKRLKK